MQMPSVQVLQHRSRLEPHAWGLHAAKAGPQLAHAASLDIFRLPCLSRRLLLGTFAPQHPLLPFQRNAYVISNVRMPRHQACQ